MYLQLLSMGNREFADGVQRRFPNSQSPRLSGVLKAVEAAQTAPIGPNLVDLLNALENWRRQDPKEFLERGEAQGLAYRLWMEAKQSHRNLTESDTTPAAPPMPAGCPGTLLLGVYVPEGERNEICHGFAYRWAVAAGAVPESPTLKARKDASSFNGTVILPVLYPGGWQSLSPARVKGSLQLQPGDIVAMFEEKVPREDTLLDRDDVLLPEPGHSMIVTKTPEVWFSCNNIGTFGVTGERREIDTRDYQNQDGRSMGWVSGGNRFRRIDNAIVRVMYRRPTRGFFDRP